MKEKNTMAVAGEGLSQKCREALLKMGFEVFILPPYPRLGKGVDTHADLMLFPLDGRVFIYGEIVGSIPTLAEKLLERGYEIAAVDTPPEKKYPRDIALNLLKVGRYIFCNEKYASAEVLKYAVSRGYTVVNTNQGYARCTACPLSDRGIVTADPSILNAVGKTELACLSVSAGSVELQGFEYGFMGGACGFCGDTLYFAGSLKGHPDAERIEAFCQGLGVRTESLSEERLTDVGSIFFF